MLPTEPGPVSTARPTNNRERMRASRGTGHEQSRAAVRNEHRKQEVAPLSHQPVALSFVTACGTLNRQTTLPPVGRGPRLRRFAPFRSRSTPRASPPSGRGVCLIFSSCPGSLTTMTGSELAGHRLLEVLVAPCCGTALLARRGGLTPPLNRPPPPGAPRLLPPPRGAGSPRR